MKDNGLFSIQEFASFSRTSKDILHHYDKTGLLPPAVRGENKYRYYSHRQLTTINLIRTLSALGMSLSEIAELQNNRTPEHMIQTFDAQIDVIDAKIDQWVRTRKLLTLLQNSMRSALNITEQDVTIQFMPAEAIVLGSLNDYDGNKNDFDVLRDFYNETGRKYPKIDMNYPVWAIFSKDRIINKDWRWPDRYYFYNPEGFDKRPAAYYAVGYARGGYGQTDELYERLITYIEENGHEICGNTYEEYPLNEVCMLDEADYLVRVMITVCKKNCDG